jgi:hypothetical protein
MQVRSSSSCLEDDTHTREANALVEKQRGQMITQHKNLCPWRDRQCDCMCCPLLVLVCIADGHILVSIYTVQIKAPGVLARELKARSLALDPLLKDVNIQHPLVSVPTVTYRGDVAEARHRPPLTLGPSRRSLKRSRFRQHHYRQCLK